MFSHEPFLTPPPPSPNRHAKSDEELTPADWAYIGWAVTDKARREAIAFNHPVTIGRNGWVIRLWPDGREERVKPITRPPIPPGTGRNGG